MQAIGGKRQGLAAFRKQVRYRLRETGLFPGRLVSAQVASRRRRQHRECDDHADGEYADFRTNTLGTCKHLIYALARITKKFPPAKRRKYRRKQFSVQLDYCGDVSLHLHPPHAIDETALQIAGKQLGKACQNVKELVNVVSRLERAGYAVDISPDAGEWIDRQLFQDRMAELVTAIRKRPDQHPLRKELLKTELLPYQLDGIAFAAGAGRAVLADDMGLGKTIQGIGVAELLAREASIQRVLVICPTSLKSQWRNEIERFCERDCQLVVGSAEQRAEQYSNDCFYTICNYEQVLRDLEAIEAVTWYLIVLDEGQRIKNWEAKTTRVVKSLKSTYALVLSGTPLENRLDELFSVVQFIDDRRLGPGFRFFNRHRMVDEKGKVLGYRNLAELRHTLAPILLRRTRDQVLDQLPPRTTEIVRIAPTDEQLTIHNAHMQIVAQVVRKPFISEMDLLRLQKALLMCRMSADGTYLVNKQEPSFSSKLERLDELLAQLTDEGNRKIIVFSEWTTMLTQIETLLKKKKLRYVRLDGKVPQKQRQALVNEFQTDPACQLFLTSNAGSTGLNLQAANTVINVDLPWNPAILEQRIARAHRMGQRNPVQVYLLVTEKTLEENLLVTLEDKHNLALAALDTHSEVDVLEMVSGMEEMRRRLEILLGAKPEAPLDASQKLETATAIDARRERVATAGGEMLGAVFHFLGELVAQSDASAAPPDEMVHRLRDNLRQCTKADEQGRQQLTVTLPDAAALDGLAKTLARLLVNSEQ
jgi:superfamily II DNA or RNA helicase